MKELSNDVLIKTYCQEQKVDALAELMRRVLHLSMGISMKYLKNKMDAEDLVSDLYLKLQVDLCRFNILDFPAWVSMVTKNMALSQLRSKSRKPQEESLENFVEIGSTDHLLEVEEKETLLLCLDQCLEQLQGHQKRCISLFFLENKSYSEIQEITQMDFKSVKTHLQNGKRMLRLLMEKQGKS